MFEVVDLWVVCGQEEVRVVQRVGVGQVVLRELLEPGATFTPQEFLRESGGETGWVESAVLSRLRGRGLMCVAFGCWCSGGETAEAFLHGKWVAQLHLWSGGSRELWHPEIRKEFARAEAWWVESWGALRSAADPFSVVTVIINTTAETFACPHFDWTGECRGGCRPS